MTHHDHPPEGECPPSCPGWSEGALELYALLRRHDAMLAACRAAERIEYLIVAPATPGAELPELLHGEQLVRLNLVVGRDCPEVMLDEWGLRTNLTFRGRRHDCAIPWGAVMAGVLVAPPRRRPRFGVVAGGVPAEAPAAVPGPGLDRTPTPAPAAAPASLPSSAPPPTQPPPGPPGGAPAPTRPRPVFGVIPGGLSEKKG